MISITGKHSDKIYLGALDTSDTQAKDAEGSSSYLKPAILRELERFLLEHWH